MTISIPESGVTFGPFAEEDCYPIEIAPAYRALGQHVKIAEFIVKLMDRNDNDYLALVEAKSSIPRESDDFFAEIREKLVNTFTLLMLASMGRQPLISDELPANIRDLSLASCDIRLFIVIPLVPDKYLASITDKFRQVLRVECKTWKVRPNDLWVLNSDRAQRKGLIVGE